MGSIKDPSQLSTPEFFVLGGFAACVAVRANRTLRCDKLILIKVTFSNPAEVAKTRLQLQGELAKGGQVKVYRNAIDTFAKTWRNEGIRGIQRGLGAAVSPPIPS